MAQIAETGMAVHNLDLLPDEDLAEDGEAGEHCREGRAAVHDPVRDVIDFDAVGQVADASASGIGGVVRRSVGMGDDDHLVAAVDEFLQCVDQQIYETCWR